MTCQISRLQQGGPANPGDRLVCLPTSLTHSSSSYISHHPTESMSAGGGKRGRSRVVSFLLSCFLQPNSFVFFCRQPLSMGSSPLALRGFEIWEAGMRGGRGCVVTVLGALLLGYQSRPVACSRWVPDEQDTTNVVLHCIASRMAFFLLI